jgi:predicted RND superfamily exporter protein
LTIILAVAITMGIGIQFIRVETNPINYFSKASPVYQSAQVVNKHFGGSSTISVVAKGDIKAPSVMTAIDQLEQQIANLPVVGSTASIAKVVRQMNEVMHDDDSAYDVIPTVREQIAQYFLLYSMNGEPDDFDRMIDFPYAHAQISARLNDNSSAKQKETIDAIKEIVAQWPDSPFMLVGGFADLFSSFITLVVRDQVISLLLSIVVVMCLVGGLFRSFGIGIIAGLPIGLAIVVLFGVMGYFNIELNLVTSLLSSVMIGVGIDYSIHFLWRYREERQKGLDQTEAVFTTLTTTGRGIIFNALSVVVGFSVLLVSSFLPIQFYGLLLVVSISTCLVGALIMLPALAQIGRIKWLEPKKETNTAPIQAEPEKACTNA